MSDTLGAYIHIPFCGGAKCPYCDFYSVPFEKEAAETCIKALRSSFEAFSERARDLVVDTVYFGGGTPSVLGTGLARLLEELRALYHVAPDAEITFEANPGEAPRGLFAELRGAGFNRVSLGLQSGSGRN